MKPTHCPGCGLSLEGAFDERAGWWRFRVRLYDMELDKDSPMADSDSDLEPDQPGREIVRGLPLILHKMATAAFEWHGGEQLKGLGGDALERKTRGVRPTLSRNAGRATVRIEYDTLDSFSENPGHVPRYLARVDILKTAEPEGRGPAGIPDESPYDQTH